ncbi:MAG: hypothetical protein BRD49_03145 [Bacteroidetes bacterium SW_10_40_5]|nr:MAG: hypothetical protein BRD49_03145 [Bacteroidetes bacterium SW_10_40_5]
MEIKTQISRLQNDTLPEPFEQKHETNYGQLLYNSNYQAIIIEALESYIPIESFQDIFNKATSSVQQAKVSKVIFDKRNLRTFHQPSMEWYFIHWKTEMYNLYGLTKHIKLLPNLHWFHKAVEAGKAEIMKKEASGILQNMNIMYVDSIKEALKR